MRSRDEKNHPRQMFLRIAMLCSFAGAITTALLIFLPNPIAPDFESQSLLFQNKLYLTKKWILFIHPQVNIVASLAIAYLLVDKYPWQMIIGSFFLLIWAYSELSQQALLIDALNQIWRPGYLDAENEVTKNRFRTLIEAANGLSDSKYFLVIYGFGMGTLFFGLAFIFQNGLAKWIGIALSIIGVLSLLSFARYYLDLNSLNLVVNWFYNWIYPYLQPAVRIAIGVWLYQQMDSNPGGSRVKYSEIV